jgi:hypothetical protein
MTVLTRAKTTGMSRKTGLGMHYSCIFERTWSTVEKWRSELGPGLILG